MDRTLTFFTITTTITSALLYSGSIRERILRIFIFPIVSFPSTHLYYCIFLFSITFRCLYAAAAVLLLYDNGTEKSEFSNRNQFLFFDRFLRIFKSASRSRVENVKDGEKIGVFFYVYRKYICSPLFFSSVDFLCTLCVSSISRISRSSSKSGIIFVVVEDCCCCCCCCCLLGSDDGFESELASLAGDVGEVGDFTCTTNRIKG